MVSCVHPVRIPKRMNIFVAVNNQVMSLPGSPRRRNPCKMEAGATISNPNPNPKPICETVAAMLEFDIHEG